MSKRVFKHGTASPGESEIKNRPTKQQQKQQQPEKNNKPKKARTKSLTNTKTTNETTPKSTKPKKNTQTTTQPHTNPPISKAVTTTEVANTVATSNRRKVNKKSKSLPQLTTNSDEDTRTKLEQQQTTATATTTTTHTTIEGRASVLCGEDNIPGEIGFYNPAMRFSRDLSVLLLNHYAKSDWKAFDAFASTGVLAIRWGKEVELPVEIFANDIDDKVNIILKTNVKNNELSSQITVLKENANVTLHSKNFDFIHLDPYGTVATCLDSTFNSITNGGIVNITTTDMTGICGNFPKVAMRNYGAVTSDSVPFYRELGARVVIAAAARSAARFNKAIEVLTTFMRYRSTHQFNKEHFLCIALKVKHDIKAADATIDLIKPIYYHPQTQHWSLNRADVVDNNSSSVLELGPLWVGSVANFETLKILLQQAKLNKFHQGVGFIKVLEHLNMESNYSDLMFYQTIPSDIIAEKNEDGKITIGKCVSLLREKRYRASKTHWHSKSLKTNATFTQTTEIIKKYLMEQKKQN